MKYQEPNLEILTIGNDVITSSDTVQEKPAGGNSEGGELDDLFPNPNWV